ncbi:hypothetical protein KP509_1Z007700 [Ceratopteris richardii]|nr:hypothetical protein KP509_1Z007700 [Ceratopteris richardii]
MAVLPSQEGRVSLLKLVERMKSSFCCGVSASTTHSWLTLAATGIEAFDVPGLVRKTVNVLAMTTVLKGGDPDACKCQGGTFQVKGRHFTIANDN